MFSVAQRKIETDYSIDDRLKMNGIFRSTLKTLRNPFYFLKDKNIICLCIMENHKKEEIIRLTLA